MGKKNFLAYGPKCVHTAHPSIHGNQTREAFQLIVEAENKLKILRFGTFVPLFTVPRRQTTMTMTTAQWQTKADLETCDL